MSPSLVADILLLNFLVDTDTGVHAIPELCREGVGGHAPSVASDMLGLVEAELTISELQDGSTVGNASGSGEVGRSKGGDSSINSSSKLDVDTIFASTRGNSASSLQVLKESLDALVRTSGQRREGGVELGIVLVVGLSSHGTPSLGFGSRSISKTRDGGKTVQSVQNIFASCSQIDVTSDGAQLEGHVLRISTIDLVENTIDILGSCAGSSSINKECISTYGNLDVGVPLVLSVLVVKAAETVKLNVAELRSVGQNRVKILCLSGVHSVDEELVFIDATETGITLSGSNLHTGIEIARQVQCELSLDGLAIEGGVHGSQFLLRGTSCECECHGTHHSE